MPSSTEDSTLELFGRKKKQRQQQRLEGGFTPQQASGCLVLSSPLPMEAKRDAAFSTGKGRLQGMMAGDPPSPTLSYRATDKAIYFINPDDTLYMEIAWDDVTTEVKVADDGTLTGQRSYNPMDLTFFELNPEHDDPADVAQQINERADN